MDGKFLMSCQKGHRGQILPHVEILSRDVPAYKDVTSDGEFTVTFSDLFSFHKETESSGLSQANTPKQTKSERTWPVSETLSTKKM